VYKGDVIGVPEGGVKECGVEGYWDGMEMISVKVVVEC